MSRNNQNKKLDLILKDLSELKKNNNLYGNESESQEEYEYKVSLVEDELDDIILMIKTLIKYPNNINFNIYGDKYTIEINDLSTLKNDDNKQSLTGNKFTDRPKSLSIYVSKDRVDLSKGWSCESRFYDNNSYVYDNTILLIKDAIKSKFINNMNDMVYTIKEESGILRDINFDKIMNKIKKTPI